MSGQFSFANAELRCHYVADRRRGVSRGRRVVGWTASSARPGNEPTFSAGLISPGVSFTAVPSALLCGCLHSLQARDKGVKQGDGARGKFGNCQRRKIFELYGSKKGKKHFLQRKATGSSGGRGGRLFNRIPVRGGGGSGFRYPPKISKYIRPI